MQVRTMQKWQKYVTCWENVLRKKVKFKFQIYNTVGFSSACVRLTTGSVTTSTWLWWAARSLYIYLFWSSVTTSRLTACSKYIFSYDITRCKQDPVYMVRVLATKLWAESTSLFGTSSQNIDSCFKCVHFIPPGSQLLPKNWYSYILF